MKLIFFTSNPEKLQEAQVTLAQFGMQVIGQDFSFIEPREGTLEEIAEYKLGQINNLSVDPYFVDDSGIFFTAYPNFPGILSKKIFNLIGYRGINKLLLNEDRTAAFQGVTALKYQGKIKMFKGTTKGRIITDFPSELPNDLRFPFDPVFIPDGAEQVLAKLPKLERIGFSYRKRALEEMGEWLKAQEQNYSKN